MLLLRGRKASRNDRLSVRAEKIIPLEEVRDKYVDKLEISLRVLGLEESFLQKIKEMLLANAGNARVFITLLGEKRERFTIQSRSIRVSINEKLIRDLKKLVGDGAVKIGGALP